jgi:hypothetical protein
MIKSPLLPIAVVCATTFATLGCLRPHPTPHYVHAPTEVEEEAAPSGKSGSNGAKSSNRGSGSGSGSNTPAPPPKVIPTSMEVHSDCSKTVPVFFGDGKPGFSSGRKSSISSNTISTEPRNFDGTLTIWIIDEHENGLTNIKLTPDNKRVTVNSDCKSFKAD